MYNEKELRKEEEKPPTFSFFSKKWYDVYWHMSYNSLMAASCCSDTWCTLTYLTISLQRDLWRLVVSLRTFAVSNEHELRKLWGKLKLKGYKVRWSHGGLIQRIDAGKNCLGSHPTISHQSIDCPLIPSIPRWLHGRSWALAPCLECQQLMRNWRDTTANPSIPCHVGLRIVPAELGRTAVFNGHFDIFWCLLPRQSRISQFFWSVLQSCTAGVPSVCVLVLVFLG